MRTYIAFAALLASLALAPLSAAQTAPPVAAQQAPLELRVQMGHGSQVNAVAVSPDGRLALSRADDGAAILWDLASGRGLRTIRERLDGIAWSPDGARIAYVDKDARLAFLDVASGTTAAAAFETGPVLSSAWSPDGRRLVTSGVEGSAAPKTDGEKAPAAPVGIRVWDVASGKLLRRLESPDLSAGPSTDWVQSGDLFGPVHRGAPGIVAWSPDGNFVAACGVRGVSVWEMATGALVRTLTARPVMRPAGEPLQENDYEREYAERDEARGPNALAFSRDGRRLLTSGDDRTVRYWDLAQGVTLCAIGGLRDTYGVAVAPDGRTGYLATHYTITILDLERGAVARTLVENQEVAEGSNPWSMALLPDGGRILGAGDFAHAAALFDTASGERALTLERRTGDVRQARMSPDGRLAYAETRDTIRVFEVASGKPVLSLNARSPWFAEKVTTAWSPDGKRIASRGEDEFGPLALWDVTTGRRIGALEGLGGRAEAIGFSRDGRAVFAAYGSMVRFYDAASGATVAAVSNPALRADEVALSPDGGRVYVSAYKSIGCYERPGGRQVWSKPFGAQYLRLSGDGKRLLAIGDGRLGVLDPASGAVLLSAADLLRSARGMLLTAEWHPDGARVAVADTYGTVTVVNAATGEAERIIHAHDGAVRSVSFSPDGKRIMSAATDGTIKLWDAATGALICTTVCDDAGDFATWTPDGYFVATERAQREFVYAVQGTTILPIERLAERYYQPAVIRARVLGEPDPSLGAVADIRKGVTPAPLVRFASPRAGEAVAVKAEAYRVVVEVTDQGGGVDEVRLYQNGKLVSEENRGFAADLSRSKAGAAGASPVTVSATASPSAREVLTRTFDVRLAPGVNALRAVALNRERTESSPALAEVVLEGAQPTAALYVLAVGVNRYKNERLSLSFSRPDAEAVVAALEKGGAAIFSRIEKRTLFDEAATRAGIEAAVGEIAAVARPGDAFAFYFAGHGVMSEGGEGRAPEFYLVPHDVRRLYGDDEGLAAKGVPASLLRDLSRRVPAQKQLLVLDACQSGGALQTFAMRGAAEEKAMYQLARSSGVVLLAATGTEQAAAEVGKLGHGIFTYALLQGLAGAADGGAAPDGKVTVKELESYLNDRVPELTREHRGAAQDPLSFALGQDFPIAVK